MPYVYRHIRLDKNQPFYIGIGSDEKYSRANDLKPKRRNFIWRNIASKTNIIVEIIFDNLTWNECCEKEKEFIKLYGRIDNSTGILSNLTDGGDGSVGIIISQERRKILSNNFSGKGNPMYGKTHPKIIIEQIRQKNLNRIAWNRGLNTGENKKLSISKKGCLAWNKGLYNVNGKGNSKIVLNLDNGIFYDSCKEASITYCFKHTTLKSKLNGTNKNNTNLIYV